MFKQITGAYFELVTLAHVEDIQRESYAILHNCSLPVAVVEEGVQLLIAEIWDTLDAKRRLPFRHYPPEQILAMQYSSSQLTRWQPISMWLSEEIQFRLDESDYFNPNIHHWRNEFRVNHIELGACMDVAAELFVLALPLIAHNRVTKVELTVDTRDVYIELRPRMELAYVESLGNL